MLRAETADYWSAGLVDDACAELDYGATLPAESEERNQSGAAQLAAVYGSGSVLNQPAVAGPLTVPGGGAHNQPSAMRPHPIPGEAARNQSTAVWPSAVFGDGARN